MADLLHPYRTRTVASSSTRRTMSTLTTSSLAAALHSLWPASLPRCCVLVAPLHLSLCKYTLFRAILLVRCLLDRGLCFPRNTTIAVRARDRQRHRAGTHRRRTRALTRRGSETIAICLPAHPMAALAWPACLAPGTGARTATRQCSSTRWQRSRTPKSRTSWLEVRAYLRAAQACLCSPHRAAAAWTITN